MGFQESTCSAITNYRRWISYLIFLVFVVGLTFVNIRHSSASVTLLYFRALPDDGEVTLEWETATEIDSAGFFVSRSTTQNSGFEQISDFIPSEGDSVVGAYYDYLDATVENGVTYYYILESWDYDNSVSYSDPVSATPGSTSQTATATATVTTTISPSPTTSVSPSVTVIPAETNTPAPTQTNSPVPSNTPIPSNTPTAPVTDAPTSLPTATVVDLFTATPSATFLPLPTIIIVYPTAAVTATYIPSSTPTATQEPQEEYLQAGFRTLGVIGLICVIGMLWVMLAIWIFLLIRRFIV
jgi:hypothetical protein